MNKLPNPKDVLLRITGYTDIDKLSYDRMEGEEVLEAMKEYGRQVKDTTLEWAAENAEANIQSKLSWSDEYTPIAVIDKESILLGKTSKDLEI